MVVSYQNIVSLNYLIADSVSIVDPLAELSMTFWFDLLLRCLQNGVVAALLN